MHDRERSSVSATTARLGATATTADTETQKVPVTAANVRDVVTCSDCGKPRCLFAAKKLGKEEAETLEQAKEDVDFVCGGSIFAPDHPLASKVGTRIDISCSTDVTSHYFASASEADRSFASSVAVTPFPVAEEVSSKFQSAHPMCQECFAKGVRVRT